MEEAFRDQILQGVSRLEAAIKLDVGAFEDESALGQLLSYPVLDHGVLETLKSFDVLSVSITNLI